MNQKCTTWTALAASIFAGGALATNSQGQTSDTLLNALIKKGIITEQEAKDIKAEANKDSQTQFNQSFTAKTGMASWINNYKLYGDFRGRFEENYADNAGYNARERYRYRLRLGLNVSMMDNLDIGLRLASGNPQTKTGGALVGGQSITANQDLNSLETRKFIWIDAAYGKWTPIKNNDFTLSATIGKMDNPFQLSNMIWDYDINPEGGALQAVYNINDQHALKGIGGIYILDEVKAGSLVTGSGTGSLTPTTIHAGHDPYVYGGQLLFESKWTPKIDTSLGVAAFNIVHKDSLSAFVQPSYNVGNTRTANGFLTYSMNPIIGTASATYKLATFPGYTGQFPIKLAGEYMDNPPAPSKQNKAWRAGVTFGKAGRKNTWEIAYRYQRLEADAWYDALVDDDNGAFYTAGTAGPGSSGNRALNSGLVNQANAAIPVGAWLGGTNVKGHQVVATYSFTDSLNFTFIYYRNEAIINENVGIDKRSDVGHFMADLNWKF